MKSRAYRRFSLTIGRLKHLLHYDPCSGAWTWLNPNPRAGRQVGQIAGSVNRFGYRLIRVDCETYRSARLAWFYMTGEWPVYEMDHINGDRGDDRWENLRSVCQAQNLLNRRFSLLRGITNCGRKFSVSSCGEYLGMFERLEPAVAIRDFALWYRGESINREGIAT